MKPPVDSLASWLVGGRLSCVLHLGDGELAYRLSDAGHEVVVMGDDVRTSRHPEVQYVRAIGDRLPFISDAFDVVIAPHLSDAPTALADYARVLRPGGHVATVSRSHDATVPWVRRLHDIIGPAAPPLGTLDTLDATGLFHPAEVTEIAAWEELDLAGLLQFARSVRPGLGDAELARVSTLFDDHASGTGTLRLRHRTQAWRATVDASALTPAAPPPDTLLLDFR